MRTARLASTLSSATLFAAAAVAAGDVRAQDGELTQHPLGESDAPYGYVEYLPPGFSQNVTLRRPLVVMLHGAGERGSNLDAVNAHGPTKQIQNGDTFWGDKQAVVIAPQVPTDGWWNADLVAQLVDEIVDQRHIDAYQVIVTGLSMGGGGTWDYVRAQGRSRISVALPICGASGPGDGIPFTTTPTWAFHAWGDGTVGRGNSIGWVNNIADAIAGSDVPPVLDGYPHVDGNPNNAAADDQSATFDGAAWTWASGVDTSGTADLRLTLYPDGSHDSWTRTYDNADVREWMFANRRADPAEAIGATIVVDNLDDGVTFGGAWARNADGTGFWGWDQHRATGGAGVEARFTTPASAGRYEVFLAYSAAEDRGIVEVKVQRGVLEGIVVDIDQSAGGGFVSLGEIETDGTSEIEVLVDGAESVGTVVADAIALRPVGETSGAGGGGAGGAGAGGGDGDGDGDGGGDGDGDGGGDGGGDGDGPSGPASGPGSSGAGAPAGAGGAASDDDAAEDDGGCDCRIDRQGPASSGSALAALAVGLGAVIARRRRRG